MSSWYTVSAPEDDITVSTRIRLARNLSDLPFPARMSSEEKKELNLRVKAAISESDTPIAKSLKYISMADIPSNEIEAMVERHIISPEFAKHTENRAVIISEDESVSVMIGEEDHIRIQVILGGLQLEKAYEAAQLVDDILCSALGFAFDKDLGYLTECPTNLGTGLRASVMLHLPILENSGDVLRVKDSVGKIGFTIRGMYGEGSAPLGAMYQVSNQITLGISEKHALSNLKIIANQLIEGERTAREGLNRLKTEDLCMRSLGILKNCRILTSEEMMNLLSKLKLGISMGIIETEVSPIRLFIEGQPHMLMKKYGITEPAERDIYRASLMREELSD